MQNDKNNAFLSNLTKMKSELLELLLIAIAVAVGVNLFSEYIAGVIGTHNSGLWGGLIILLTLVLVFYRRFFKRTVMQRDEAVISVDQKNNFLNVKGYEFNDDFGMILDSLFAENRALKRQWADSSLGRSHKSDAVSQQEFLKSKSQKLVKEVTEYIYLSNLSVHLTDYFSGNAYNKKWLVELSRDNISEIVTSNRVLDMISRDMSDRAAFMKKDGTDKNSDGAGEIVMSWIQGGAMYAKFDLTLPKGSRVIREANGSITIKNSSLELNFRVVSQGFGAIVDHLFEKYYMDIDDKSLRTIKHYAVDIITSISIRPTFAIFGKRFKYQLWSESFLNSLRKDIDFSTFLDEINWRTIKTFLTVEKKSKPKSRQLQEKA